MSRPLPNLAALLAFDAVAQRQSFSAAGRELHLTQGAISHRIRLLEEELGVRLFVRSTRSVELTAEGVALRQATADAFARLRSGLAEVASLGADARLTVSCSPSFAIRWLVPHVRSLREVAPELDVHIAAQDELVSPGTGAIDVCIRFGPGGYSGLRAERLLAETVTPVCSPSYAERLQLREPADLRRCDLLHNDVLVDHPAHVGWAEWFVHAGVEHPHPTRGMRFSHAHLALDAATAGLGVALGRRALTAEARRSGLLVAPFTAALPSRLTYWLVTPRIPRRPEAVARFHEWIVGALAADEVGRRGARHDGTSPHVESPSRPAPVSATRAERPPRAQRSASTVTGSTLDARRAGEIAPSSAKREAKPIAPRKSHAGKSKKVSGLKGKSGSSVAARRSAP